MNFLNKDYFIWNENIFDWDEEKRKNNLKKHKIDFREAATVFDDPNAISKYDFDNSYDEDRFVIIGTSKQSRTLIVCHCFRENGDIVRIISARKATASERKQYEGG